VIEIDLAAAYRGFHALPPEQQLLESFVPIDVRLPSGEVVIQWWNKTTNGRIPSDAELVEMILESRRNSRPK
jgi:hypothetical protein